MTSFFPTWPVDGPPPIPPVHGLLGAAEAPAAGVRIVVDTATGPHDMNDIAPGDAGLEAGLFRRPDGTVVLRVPTPSQRPGYMDEEVYLPDNAGRERWLSGVEVYPYPPDVPDVWDACVTGSMEGAKSFGTPVTPPSFAAITLAEPITCTSFQVPDQAAFRARAVTALAAVESYGLARLLLTGAGVGGIIPGQPYLADGAGVFPNGNVATKPSHALQLLEEQVALTGRLGIIHCTPMMATALLGQGFALKDVTGVIRTINGVVVVPDFGYVPSATPIGHPAALRNQEWAYATGPIDIRRSEVFTTPDTLAEALDRGTSTGATNGRPNTFTYRAERYASVIWDTVLQAAVLVDRCSTDCAVGS